MQSDIRVCKVDSVTEETSSCRGSGPCVIPWEHRPLRSEGVFCLYIDAKLAPPFRGRSSRSLTPLARLLYNEVISLDLLDLNNVAPFEGSLPKTFSVQAQHCHRQVAGNHLQGLVNKKNTYKLANHASAST